jgi:7,8-dihydroneopterin aldolase/epimerase/oxygenase
MAVIALEGMRFRAFHGLYEEERILGNDFILNIEIVADISKASVVQEHGVEKVDNTINYETVYEISRIEMATPHKLLETLIESIVMALKWQFKTINQVSIKVKKLNPPLGGRVDASYVENTYNFVKQCGRCGSPLICYNDKTCWCHEERFKVHPRTLEMLTTQYKGCLCRKCLAEYAG